VSSLLHRIAVFSARRRALVIGVWLVLLVGVGMASHAAGTKYSSSAEVAGSDSAAANDVMARSFDENLSDASPVVFHTDQGKLTDDEHRAVVEASVKELSQAENVASVSDP
jgi:RND superfamily putative drug exporter